MTTDPSACSTRICEHEHCWVCGANTGDNLAVDFVMNPDGEIEACFACDPRYTGYDGYLHGGVISSLLDGAMTNWLLASGRRSMTADLSVRFQRPVVIGEPVDIRAHLERSRRAVDVLQAELLQQGQVCATAVGKFMKHPDAR